MSEREQPFNRARQQSPRERLYAMIALRKAAPSYHEGNRDTAGTLLATLTLQEREVQETMDRLKGEALRGELQKLSAVEVKAAIESIKLGERQGAFMSDDAHALRIQIIEQGIKTIFYDLNRFKRGENLSYKRSMISFGAFFTCGALSFLSSFIGINPYIFIAGMFGSGFAGAVF